MTKSELAILIDASYKNALSEVSASISKEIKGFSNENGELTVGEAIPFALHLSCLATSKVLNKVLSDVLELDDQ